MARAHFEEQTNISKQSWSQASSIWVILANANRDPKAHPEPFTEHDVNPWKSTPETPEDEKDRKRAERIAERFNLIARSPPEVAEVLLQYPIE